MASPTSVTSPTEGLRSPKVTSPPGGTAEKPAGGLHSIMFQAADVGPASSGFVLKDMDGNEIPVSDKPKAKRPG